jgi:hypothetical protein
MDRNNLLDDTKRLLEAREDTFKVLAAETGLGFEWLSKLSQGRIPNPGVRKVQCLYDYLSSRPDTAT